MARISFAVLFLSDWLFFSSSLIVHYHFVNKSLTWTEAQTYCRETYEDLAAVNNSEEMTQLLDRLSSVAHDSEVWIGLFSEIEWKWSDGFSGSGADYRSWALTGTPLEPNFGSANQLCVRSNNGKWVDDFCAKLYPFLCNNGTELDPEYVYIEEEMSWSSAQTFCRETFSDLATVRNNTENQMAQSLVPSGYSSWIGLFREPCFHWSDGSTFLFHNWDNVYYSIRSLTVICGVTSINRSGKLRFLSCETKLPFVCYSLDAEIKRHVVKLRLKTEDSLDLSEPVLKANILTKLQGKLEENGVSGAILKWVEQNDERDSKKENIPKKNNP